MLGGIDGDNAHGAMLTSVEQVQSRIFLKKKIKIPVYSKHLRRKSSGGKSVFILHQYTNSPGVERDWKMEFPPLPEPRFAFKSLIL